MDGGQRRVLVGLAWKAGHRITGSKQEIGLCPVWRRQCGKGACAMPDNQLAQAFASTGAVLSTVRPEQIDLPIPFARPAAYGH